MECNVTPDGPLVPSVIIIEMNEGEKEKKRKKDKKKEDKERKAREREARRKKREQVEKEAKEKERELRRKGIETKAFTPREEADIGELSDAGSVDSLDSQHDYLETHHVDNPMVRLALSATNEIEGGTCPALSLSLSPYTVCMAFVLFPHPCYLSMTMWAKVPAISLLLLS